jgi:serine/threonine-protein kinase
MLATNPADRFSSSAELAEALERYIYHDHYGPTIVTLAKYLQELMPGRFPELPAPDCPVTKKMLSVTVDQTVVLS